MSWRNILKDEAAEERHYNRLKEMGEDVGVEQARDIFSSLGSNIIEDVDKILYDIFDEKAKEIKDMTKDFEREWDSSTARIPGVKGNVGGKFISEIYEQMLMHTFNYAINKRRPELYISIFNSIKGNTAIPMLNDFDNETFKANVNVSPEDYFSTLILEPASDRGLGSLFDEMELDDTSWNKNRRVFRSRLIKIIDKNTANYKIKVFEPSPRSNTEIALLPTPQRVMDTLPKETRNRNILYAKVPIDGGPPATFKMSLQELLILLINVNRTQILGSRLYEDLLNNINEKLSSFWGVNKNYAIDMGRDEEYEQGNVTAEFSLGELGEEFGRTLIPKILMAQSVINNTIGQLKDMEVNRATSAKYDKRLYTYGELGATPPEGKTAKDVVEAFTDRTKKLTQSEIKQQKDVDLAGISIMRGDNKIGILFYKIVVVTDAMKGGTSNAFLSSKEVEMMRRESMRPINRINSVVLPFSTNFGITPITFISSMVTDDTRLNINTFVDVPSNEKISDIFSVKREYNYPSPSELVATGFASDTITDLLPQITSSEFARLVYHELSERNFIEYKFNIPKIQLGQAQLPLYNSDDDLSVEQFKELLLGNKLVTESDFLQLLEADMIDRFLLQYRGTIAYLEGTTGMYRMIQSYLGFHERNLRFVQNLFELGNKYNIDITRLLILSGLTVEQTESKIFLDVFGATRSKGEKGQRTRSSTYGEYRESTGAPHLCFYTQLKTGRVYSETAGGDVCIVLSSSVPVADAVGPISLQLLQLVNILESFSQEFDIEKFSTLKPIGIDSDLVGKFADIINRSTWRVVGDVKVV